MYGNNTIENYNYKTICENTKCVNYCSQIDEDKCESRVEARRGVTADDSSTYPGTVKRCRWDSDKKLCIATEDTCNSDSQGTKDKGYPCNTYYSAECGKYMRTKDCKKFSDDYKKCQKHYSVDDEKGPRLCDWISNVRKCQNKGGAPCKNYAYCPEYGCYYS